MKSPGGTLAAGGFGVTRTRSMLWPGASWATESANPTPAATVASAAHRTAEEASRCVFGPCKGGPRPRSSSGRCRCRVEASAGPGGGARFVLYGSAFSHSRRCGFVGGAGGAPVRPSWPSRGRRASVVRLSARSAGGLPRPTARHACRPEAGEEEAEVEVEAGEEEVEAVVAAAVGPRPRGPCRACCAPAQRSSRRTFRRSRMCV
jgi:hypothetical protein